MNPDTADGTSNAAADLPPAAVDLDPLAPRPRRVGIVGAGITGLAAAHRLHRLAPNIDIVVVDSAASPGGKIRTSVIDDLAVDEAADAFLARVPEAVALCRELGLDDELVEPAERRALVLNDGELTRLPEGLVLGVPTDFEALAASGIVSPAGLAQARQDLTPPDERNAPSAPGATHDAPDESVGSLVRRRLGDEVFEKLVAPLLGGVNAGDADRLSLAAGAPQLAAAAARGGSLVAALRQQRPAAAGGAAPPVFHGLRSGTGRLVEALVDSLPSGSVQVATTAVDVRAKPGGGFELDVTGNGGVAGTLHLDAVVLATGEAHSLVGELVPDSADGLSRLPWASVVLATLVFDRDAVSDPLEASGYLVPARERRFVTACSFASTKWAHLQRADRVVLRASAGRAGDGDAAVDMDDSALQQALLDDLAATLGIDAEPRAVRLSRWRRGLPQYEPGHLERAREWQAAAWQAAPGLWLTGAAFEGLGIPACIRQGESAARWLVSGSPSAAETAGDGPRSER